MLQLYDKLLRFSLFQGLGNNELMQIVAHTKFNFLKYQPQQTVVTQGTACRSVFLLVNGALEATTASDDNDYRMVETIEPPYIIQPERLFGLTQQFTSTFKATADTNFIIIDKKEVMRLCDNFLIFQINLINIIATATQKHDSRLWMPSPQNLEARIARFVIEHCLVAKGPKTLHIRMERLAQELNDSRLDVSRALNRLQDSNLIELGRCRIHIPSVEKLKELSHC